MAIVGLRLDATEEYVSPNDGDKGTDKATVFTLGTLSARVQTTLKDRSTRFTSDPNAENGVVAEFLPFTASYDTVRCGVVGWSNFADGTGEEILFKASTGTIGGVKVQLVAEECMDRLPVDLIRELSDRINEINSMSETDSGN
jgi:hypothetical protein